MISQAELLLPEQAGSFKDVAVARDGIYVVLREGISNRLIRIAKDETKEVILPVVG